MSARGAGAGQKAEWPATDKNTAHTESDNNPDPHFQRTTERCQYYDLEMTFKLENNLSVIHTNVGSKENKFDEIQTLLQISAAQWTAICGSETRLKREIEQFVQLR